MAIKKKAEISEVVDSAGNNVSADPLTLGDSSRSADKGGGETAQLNISPTGALSKSEMMAYMVGNLNTMGRDQVADFFSGFSASINGDSSRAADNKSGETAPIVISPTAAKPGAEGGFNADLSSVTGQGEQKPLYLSPTAAREEVDVIFTGEELTEDQKTKAATVFEAAVNARLDVEIARLHEEFEAELETAVDEIVVELAEANDKYLTHVVNEWMEENKVAIDNALKVEMAEDCINALKTVLEANHITIPNDQVDAVMELTAKVDELESKLNEAIKEKIELGEQVAEATAEAIFNELAEGLTVPQKEKLRTLSEGISWDNTEQFEKKVSVLKEQYFNTTVSRGKNVLLQESSEELTEDETFYTPEQKGYVETARRLNKR